MKSKIRLRTLVVALFLSALSIGAALALGIEDIVDGGNNHAWEEIRLPGTACGNGSQYKFYVHDNPTSHNLLVLFEGGGACWDYLTCSGQAGDLGAAHPNGIPDDYIHEFQPQFVSPLVNGADPGLPGRPKKNIATNGWDVVYVPYCTGDVHLGNQVNVYADPTGLNPPITFRHVGYQNTKAVLSYLHARFPSINKLLVTGFSAGGTATSAVYYTARRTLQPAQGYMLNDSGPIFPAPNALFASRRLHDFIKVQWNLASIFGELPPTFDPNDLGSINDMVAREFPGDRLAYTAYSSDFNYSRFSYELFFPGITPAQILATWRADQANLIARLRTYPNFSFHVPWHRPINDSHCTSIITFISSHACPSVRKKRGFEVLLPPWSQSWICPSGFRPFETFLGNWLVGNHQQRIVEPENGYNNEDPGMRIVAPLINAALGN